MAREAFQQWTRDRPSALVQDAPFDLFPGDRLVGGSLFRSSLFGLRERLHASLDFIRPIRKQPKK